MASRTSNSYVSHRTPQMSWKQLTTKERPYVKLKYLTGNNRPEQQNNLQIKINIQFPCLLFWVHEYNFDMKSSVSLHKFATLSVILHMWLGSLSIFTHIKVAGHSSVYCSQDTAKEICCKAYNLRMERHITNADTCFSLSCLGVYGNTTRQLSH
jgi:hypothetical protein